MHGDGCMGISRLKYLLRVNELCKWERVRLQKFKLQPKTFYAFPYVCLLFSVWGVVSALFNCQLTQSFGGECLYGEFLFQSSPPQPGFSLSANGKVILTYLKPSSLDKVCHRTVCKRLVTETLRGLLKSARCFLGATESRDLTGSGRPRQPRREGQGRRGRAGCGSRSLVCVCWGGG